MDPDVVTKARRLVAPEDRVLVLDETPWPGNHVRRGRPGEHADRSLDAVVTQSTGGHDLGEIQRVLVPGGRFVVMEPTGRSTHELSHYFEIERAGRPLVARVRATHDVAGHFDAVAPEYAAQVPEHVRAHYLRRKLAAFDRLLPPNWETGLGLELGCGPGWYANEVARRGRIIAIDAAKSPLRIARKSPPPGRAPLFAAADVLRLPFADATFDYAYAINTLHHLKRGEQERALREIHRVLKPDKPFLLFEINTRNRLFRYYMRHVFPRRRHIDRGDEEFIHPDRLPLVPEFDLEHIEYSTFAPDFVPRFLLPAARAAERLLERAIPRQAIHYAALLRTRCKTQS